MTTTTIAQTRRERFQGWARNWDKPRIADAVSDPDDALDTLPRFATCSYDGNESRLRLYDSLEDAAFALADEASDDCPAGPSGAIDLDTGLMYAPKVTVELVALRFSITVTYDRSHRPLTYWFAIRKDAEDFRRGLGDNATAGEIREREA